MYITMVLRYKLHLSTLISLVVAAFMGLALGCNGGTGASIAPSVVAPSNLTYPQATILATVGPPITTAIPTASGTMASYTTGPPLTSGLSLNSSTRASSGAPSAVAP